MWRLTLRSVRFQWRRFALTASAVVIGVSFVVGSFVLTDSLSASINASLESSATRSDLVVRPIGAGGGRGPQGVFGGPRSGIPLDVAARIAALEDVEAASSVVSGPSQLLRGDGTTGAFDFALLSNWPDRAESFGIRLLEGRVPSAAGEVVLDRATATDRRVEPGAAVRIATTRGVADMTVVGIAEQGGGAMVAAAPVLAVTLDQAVALVGVPGSVGFVNVTARPGTDLVRLREQVAAVVGPSASVLSSAELLDEARSRVEELLTTFVGLLLGFAAVTLLVSSFLIWNTFSVVVAQRSRELALLRAVGASRAQVRRAVVGEGAVVGLMASLVGIAGGMLLAVGLRRLVGAFGVDLPSAGLVVAPRTVAAAFAVGLGVTMISVWGPARRATRVPPVAAVAAVDATPPRRGLGVPVAGTVLVVVGVVIAGRAGTLPTSDPTGRVRTVAIGALLIFLGVAASARFLAAPVVRVIGTPWRRLGGVASKVAVDNAVRNPRRTAATASALMVGLALVVTTLVVGESVRTAIRDGLARSVSADVVADSGSIAPFDAAALRSIAAVPGVADAAPLGTSRVDTVGARGRLTVSSGDLPSLTSMVDPELSAGRLPEVVGEVAVASKWADAAGVSVGSMFELRSADAAVPVRVVGIYRRNELLDDSLTVSATLAALPGVDVADRLVFVRTAPGADAVAVASQVGEAVAAVPNSSARVTDDFVVQRTSSVDVILGIVSVLLLFSVAVAALGIANTLALSVVERTRELGLLRAVGMTRRRVRRMVRIEGVIIAAFGATLGVALGTAFGAALVAVLPAATAELHLPWARLLVLLILGALIGIAAAALPARRAARLDVLAAVTTD